MYFKTCEYCGDNLDPGERCDCREREKEKRIEYQKQVNEEQDGQIRLVFEVV